MRLLLLPTIVFTLASLALAQFPEGANPGGQFLPPPDPLTLTLDANGDRELSAKEISKAPEVLKTLDRNKDGHLTLGELTTLDRNNDGELTFEEDMTGNDEEVEVLVLVKEIGNW